MKRAFKSFRFGTAPAGALIALVVLLAGPAIAGGPSDYCGARSAPTLGAPAASSESLENAAATLEARLAQGDAPNWEAALDAPLVAGAQPTPGALAAYCAAAGEGARRARPPSMDRARLYLAAALRYATQARIPTVLAVAAYRLSEVEIVVATGAGVRSVADPGSVIADAAQRDLLVSAAATCDPFANSTSSDAAFGEPVALLALAARCDATAGNWRNVALHDLRLAHVLIGRTGAAAGAPMPAVMVGGDKPEPRPGSAERALASGGLAVPSPVSQVRLQLRAHLAIHDGLTAAEKVTETGERSELLGHLIETALDAGEPASAEFPSLVASMNGPGRGDPGLAAYALALSGRLAMLRGDNAAARLAFEQSLFAEAQRAQPIRLPDWYMLLAQADSAERATHIRSAYLALQGVRPMMPPLDPYTGESTFTSHMRPVFEAAVDIQLSDVDGGAAAVAEAQQIFEAYRDAEIQNAFGDDCVPKLPPLTPGDLEPSEIILYPVLLADRVELIYATRATGGFRRLTPNIKSNRADVERLTAAMRASLTAKTDDWRKNSSALYDLLIEPIEAQLGPQGNLAIVPDGVLRTLPFAALIDHDGRFLVERTRLSVAPALSYSRPGSVSAGRDAIVLAAALERTVSVPGAYFPELPGTGEEARAAAGAGLGGVHGQVLDNFTRERLEKALKGAHVDVLHLATHAAFNGHADQSYIVADSATDPSQAEKIPLSALRDILSENLVRQGGLDLLVLSACDTAEGDDEASMGLAGAAVQSGARSTLASVWQVDNASTIALMKGFYGAYRAGQSKSGALRTAQLSLIASPEFRHPYYWAAFTMIGGWR